MGCMMKVLGFLVLTSLIVSVPFASAVKMDETTHDMVIQRLELGLDGMDKNEPERNGIVLRLAELYSDRARLKAMNEMESGCKNCKGALSDRKRAISLYEDGLKKADKADQGKLVLQIAHLYSLNDDDKKSETLYKQILNSKRGTYSSEVRAIALANAGEKKFREGNFKGAMKDFEAARKEKLNLRALIEFRISWCQLNLGQTDKAIRTLSALLQNPTLLATQTTDGQNPDQVFIQDLSHDLAIFLARTDVGVSQIELLKRLSPDPVRKSNLHTLADETDRLGKKQSSLVVWAAYVDEGSVTPQEKLEVQTRVAKIYYDINRQEMAANAYEKALGFWQKFGCTDQKVCPDLKARLKKFVTAWNKGQKKKPTGNLFRVYQAYNTTFPNEADMVQWQAIVGRDLGKHKESAILFHQAALLAEAQLAKNPNDKEARQIFDASLLTEIEMAEKSKDLAARETAYNFYLSKNPQGSKAFEVRYQRAQVFYQSNRFQEAFSEFHYIASTPDKDHKALRIKAADLALDCLVAMKDDKSLQVRSLEYARFFPERKTEYLKISRKASMNLVAANVKNEKNPDHGDYKASLAALAAVNMDGADDAEKIKFYKNKVTIAEKALDLGAVKDASARLLAVKTLKSDDREWTMAQQVWVAELELNFAEAYRISSQMKLADLSKADRELRLALLAELAGMNARKHHEAYVRLAPNARAANLVRVTMVRESSNQWRELEKQTSALAKTPDLLAGLTLEVFAAHPDQKKAQRMLKNTSIARYAAGQALQRHLELKNFYAFDQKIRKHRIYGYSDAAMQTTLKQRLKLIAENERLAQAAVRKHDWTMQVLTFSQLSRENYRLYHEINGLPVPRKLNAKQKAQYQALLKAKSQPYLNRAVKVEQELGEMWSSGSVQNLQATYMTASNDMQKFYRDEIVPLAQVAPTGAKNRLQNLLNTPFRRPSQRDILMARRELQASPFDVSKAEHLRELESQSGRPAMVVYLDERINQLKKGKTL